MPCEWRDGLEAGPSCHEEGGVDALEPAGETGPYMDTSTVLGVLVLRC
ncbi:hypothetical protein HMPREF1316_1632 [Olsenella profusa F0195]|uniref:Uncharacterized protein n=1 Tax=Olsenella profusa F0195 TaxID=1125712 RepID=U2V298_9ACTN|nr:hypothetical protein HMPREF1316_1632 [Olsenella profusa F0195]